MDVATVGAAMLNAAKGAAGATWSKIQHDFANDLGNVLRNAATIEAELQTGALSNEEAQLLLQNQSRTLFILTQEADQDALILAQNAVNAAIDVLWVAIKI